MPPYWPSLSAFFVAGVLVGDLNFGKCHFRVFLFLKIRSTPEAREKQRSGHVGVAWRQTGRGRLRS